MAAVFSGDTWIVRYTNQIRTRHRNWRTTSATQLQPSKSLLHPVYSYLNMIPHAQLCIDAGGNHFHHPLWWYILSAFGYCINFCIYLVLRTRATSSLPILSISSLMMATCLYPKYVAVFTCMIIAVYTRLWSIFFSLYTYESKFCLWPQFFKHVPATSLRSSRHVHFFSFVYSRIYETKGPDSSVDIATDYWLDGTGSSPSGDEIFRPSRPSLGPTHPPV